MLASTVDSTFPLSVTILCYIATGTLVIIALILVVINSKLSAIYAKLSRSAPAAIREEKLEKSPDEVEVAPGTHFEEFLNEAPERRNLPKKEQFKAYRDWRTEKGLNWSK